ncbi:MAG: CoA pyrophosphatase [Hyphomonadaceae bacterium]|nr:CoA pyrophosphatase [Hyphomonadaceae bacterium]
MSYWDDLEARLRARLDPLDRIAREAARSDRDLNPDWPRGEQPVAYRAAAVLAPIVKRPEGWTLLFTERAAELKSHAGQISFPGGRMEDGETPVEAALREAEEEIALARRYVQPIGGFDAYETGTGFRIAPIVAFIEPGFELRPDPNEVASVFEAPFDFFMDAANHERREGEWRGRKGAYYAMPYGDRFIWGATAGMIRALYERLYA